MDLKQEFLEQWASFRIAFSNPLSGGVVFNMHNSFISWWIVLALPLQPHNYPKKKGKLSISRYWGPTTESLGVNEVNERSVSLQDLLVRFPLSG